MFRKLIKKIHLMVVWLEGKKTNIVGVSSLLVSWLVASGSLTAVDGAYLQTFITGIATGVWTVSKTGSYQTNPEVVAALRRK